MSNEQKPACVKDDFIKLVSDNSRFSADEIRGMLRPAFAAIQGGKMDTPLTAARLAQSSRIILGSVSRAELFGPITAATQKIAAENGTLDLVA